MNRIDIDNMTIGEAKQLAAMFGGITGGTVAINPMLGKYCVVRTYSAGVHLGTLESQHGREVVLSNARRLWKWGGAFTLSEVSQDGIDPQQSRISTTVPSIFLTEAIEIIPASDSAIATFEACHEQ